MEDGTVRTLFVCACACAALIGWSGLSQAQDSNVVSYTYGTSYTQGEVQPDSCLFVSCQNDCSPCPSCDCGCDECLGNWLDNTQIFTGADIYKSIGDRLTNINGGTG